MNDHYITLQLTSRHVEPIFPGSSGMIKKNQALILEALKFEKTDPIDFVFVIRVKDANGASTTHEFSIADSPNAIRYEQGVAYVDPKLLNIPNAILAPASDIFVAFSIASRNVNVKQENAITLYGKLVAG